MKRNLAKSLPALLSAAALLTQLGCAGAPAVGHTNGAGPMRPMAAVTARVEAAARLCRVGRYYEASFQLEAALDMGGDEIQVLPRLAAAQIRAQRLRAAKRTLLRLITVAPGHPQAEALLQLLKSLAPDPTDTTERRAVS